MCVWSDSILYIIISHIHATQLIWSKVCYKLLHSQEIHSAISTDFNQSAPFCLWLAPVSMLIALMKCINIISFRNPATWQHSVGAHHVPASVVFWFSEASRLNVWIMHVYTISFFLRLSIKSVVTFTDPSEKDLGLYTVEISDNPNLSSSYDFTAEGQ